jgi:hypothetical protein
MRLQNPAQGGWEGKCRQHAGGRDAGSAACGRASDLRALRVQILVWKELNYGHMCEKEKHLVVSEVRGHPLRAATVAARRVLWEHRRRVHAAQS